jgi:hypothetical protein
MMGMQRYRLPRLHDLIFVVVFVGGFAVGMRMLNSDSDLGRHLALGGYILRSGHIPTQDILSYTRMGESRPPYEWLSQLLFAAAYRLLDLDGIVLLASLIIAAAFSVVFLDAAKRSGMPLVSLLITAWAAAASSLHWLTRPHVFSFLLFALWLSMLDRLRRDERQPLWQFPLVMLLWANMHGGFLFGFLALAAYAAGWLVEATRHSASGWTGRKLLLVGAMSLVASVLTPDLWHNWDAVLGNRSLYVLSRTVETMPLDPAQPHSWAFLLLFVLSAVLMLFRHRQVAAANAVLLVGLAVMGLLVARNVPFFVIAAAPLCSLWLAGILRPSRVWWELEDRLDHIDRSLGGLVWSVTAVAVGCILLGFHRSQAGATLYSYSPRLFPVAAVSWLQRNPLQGHMFNDFNWGGYLLLRMWPAEPVFIDSQSDFYGESFIRQYSAILQGAPGWDQELAGYGVNWMIIPPSTSLAMKARARSSWRIAYEDPVAIILVRR